jgi:hypothetical protein
VHREIKEKLAAANVSRLNGTGPQCQRRADVSGDVVARVWATTTSLVRDIRAQAEPDPGLPIHIARPPRAIAGSDGPEICVVTRNLQAMDRLPLITLCVFQANRRDV